MAASLAFLVLAAPSAVASADDAGTSCFPLAQGNRWTFDDSRTGAGSTMRATRVRPGVFRLDGFPGASALRVRRAGGIVIPL